MRSVTGTVLSIVWVGRTSDNTNNDRVSLDNNNEANVDHPVDRLNKRSSKSFDRGEVHLEVRERDGALAIGMPWCFVLLFHVVGGCIVYSRRLTP